MKNDLAKYGILKIQNIKYDIKNIFVTIFHFSHLIFCYFFVCFLIRRIQDPLSTNQNIFVCPSRNCPSGFKSVQIRKSCSSSIFKS